MKLCSLIESLTRSQLLAIQQEIIETDDFDFTLKDESSGVLSRDSSAERLELDIAGLSLGKTPAKTALCMFCITDIRAALTAHDVKAGAWGLTLKSATRRDLELRARKRLLSLRHYNVRVQAILGGISIIGHLIGSTQTVFHKYLESYPRPAEVFELIGKLIDAAEARA